MPDVLGRGRGRGGPPPFGPGRPGVGGRLRLRRVAARSRDAPTVLNANGANQKKFDESLLVRRGMKSQRARTNPFFGTAAREAKEASRAAVPSRFRLVASACLKKRGAIRPIREIRPIRVPNLLMRPDDPAKTLNNSGSSGRFATIRMTS